MKRCFWRFAALAATCFFSGTVSAGLNGTVLTVGPGETVAYDVSDPAQATALAALTSVVFDDAVGVLELSGAAAATLNANVTGPGKVTATGLASLTVAGDSRGFTGGWIFSGSAVTVTSRYGLGDSGTVGGVLSYRGPKSNTYPLTFTGAGLTNDVNVTCYDHHRFDADTSAKMVQNGTFRISRQSEGAGYIYLAAADFNGSFGATGGNANIYPTAGKTVRFGSPLALGGTWLNQSSATLTEIHLDAANNVWTEMNLDTGIRMVCNADNALPANKPTYFNARASNRSGHLDLNGHDQTTFVLSRKSNGKPTQGDGKFEMVTSAAPATVTMTGTPAANTYYSALAFRGKVSVDYRGAATYYLVNTMSVTEGSLSVGGGTFVIDWGAQWAGTNVTVTGGNLVLNSLNSLKDDTADLVVTGGKLTIGSGVTAFVSKATIGGASIADGLYTTAELLAAYPVAEGLVDGGGSLAVGQNKPEVVTVYDTWTGAAAPDTSLSTDGNWKDGTAPNLSDGSADLTFTEGTDLATVDGDEVAVGLHFNLSESFTLADAANATLTLGKAGISVTNVSEDASVVVTNTIFADIQNSLTAPGDVSLGPKTVLELKGRYVGGAGTSPITVTGKGEIVLEGDNSALGSPLNLIVDGNNATPFVVRVRSSTALGSSARETTIVSPCIRFECLTNDTPVCVKGYGMVNAQYDNSNYAKRLIDPGRTLVVNGAMSSYGSICGTWNLDGVTLRGGFKDNGGRMEFYVTPGNAGRVESAVDMQQATKQYSLEVSGDGDLYLSAALHRYFRIVVNGATRLVCADPNALLAAYPVLFATSTAPAGVLNLNGKDQAAAFLSHLMQNDSSSVDYGVVTSGAAFGVVTSAVPATLTLTGALTDDQCDKSRKYYCLPSNAAVKFGGLAGLHFAGESSSATQVFSFVQNDSRGALRVSSGTLLFDRGAGWSGAQDVVIDGTGVLAADAASAPVLFGKSAGRSRANLRIGGGGALNLPAGAQATVHTLRIGGTDAAHFLPAGVYGGAGAGLDAAHTLPCLTGGGTLFVRASGAGFIIMFR